MGKKSAPADKTAVKGGSDASHVKLPNGTKVRLRFKQCFDRLCAALTTADTGCK